jgi:hypothetical protein
MRMATGKRFYWMKLKESFMTSDTIDFFMSQPNGAQYVVLYQMLCLKTINTGGKLERKIGEVLIPFDIAKITRDMKWFTEDTVRVAMQLYQQFGLIYRDENGTLVMADHDNLVGSETDYAIQKKNQRNMDKPEQQKLPPGTVDTAVDTCADNVHTEIDIRDKDIRERDKEKDSLTNSEEFVCRTGDVRRVKEAWNALGLGQITTITADTVRGKSLKARIKQNGVDKVLAAVERVGKSSFLQGQNKRGWIITFDWLVKPNNFLKVLEGQYDDHASTESAASSRYSYDDA